MLEENRPRTTRIGFVSLGCPKNLVDSEVMLGALTRDGYQITADKESADVIVVNTCAFIDSAKEESIDAILEMARLKTKGNCRRLVVAGCLAERYRKELRREIPEIDFAFGPDELGRIVEAVQTDPAIRVPPLAIDALYTSKQVPTIPRLRTTPPHMAYVKIAEGCDHTCAFCAIPSFRGRFRSRTIPDLAQEAQRLADDGVREIILVSQDTLAYGRDIGVGGGIVSLLETLLEIKELAWIRLLYCYPNLLEDALIELIASEDRLCRYFDIPYQHSSPLVLKRMRRGGSGRRFERQVARIRKMVPESGIRSSFIVGFPGETDADFDQLLDFVDSVRFESLGVFVYSDEEGTAAYELDLKVDRKVALERRDILIERQKRWVSQNLDRLVGRHVRVLLDGVSPESDLLLEGRMETQAPEIDGHVLINDVAIDGVVDPGFYMAEVTGRLDYDLLGRLVSRI